MEIHNKMCTLLGDLEEIILFDPKESKEHLEIKIEKRYL